MLPTPKTYAQAQGMYQFLLEACRPLPKAHPLREVLAAAEELRDKLWLTLPLGKASLL